MARVTTLPPLQTNLFIIVIHDGHLNVLPIRWATKSELWAISPRRNPRFDERSEVHLCSRCGHAALSGMPRPSDKRIRGHVPVDIRQTASTVARSILDLQADFAERLPLPRHGGGSEPPTRIPRNACDPGTWRFDVGIPVARLAG